MGAVYFYHLTRSPLEETLPSLLQKARGAGWRVAVRGTDPARIAWLDDRLWLGDGFLPHGVAGGSFDADQPVLLTTGTGAAPNDPTCVMCVDGALIASAEVIGLQRTCILFDGNDPAAVETARDQWRTLTAGGCPAKYWSQDGGGWQMKAEAG